MLGIEAVERGTYQYWIRRTPGRAMPLWLRAVLALSALVARIVRRAARRLRGGAASRVPA